MSDEQPVRFTLDGGVATLWLDRPAKRNAVNLAMWEAIPGVLDEILAASPRAVVVRGTGGHFCAGADITGLGTSLADAGVPGGYREVNARAEDALVAFPLPVIAVIEGNCIGGGWQIASACDLRVAGASTLLGITPARLGITYPPEAVRRTMALVGPAATKRLLFTGELIDGLRAGAIESSEVISRLHAGGLAMALTYGVCGLLFVPLAVGLRPYTRTDWVAAAQYASAWLVSMVGLYCCFGLVGVVFGNILQSTRGVMSVAIGAALAHLGWHELEQRVDRATLLRRLAAALLMTAAIALYVVDLW